MGVDGCFAFAPSLRVSDCCAHCPVYLRWMQYFSFLQFNPQIFPYSKCKERHTLPFCNLRSPSLDVFHTGRGEFPLLCLMRYAIKILGVVEFKHVPHKELVLDAEEHHFCHEVIQLLKAFPI